MHAFEFVEPRNPSDASTVLASDPQARAVAGGTDLIPEIRLGIRVPDRLVTLGRLDDMRGITLVDGIFQVGALTHLADLAEHSVAQQNFSALCDAISLAASPQIRNQATLGGSLCQESRCWYFRGPFQCWLKGGTRCDAKDGDNRAQGVFGGGPCFTVHPSDPATALVALDARITILGVNGERTISIDDFFTLPHNSHRILNCLETGDIIKRVDLPWPAEGTRSAFLKAMDRAAFGFALASVACVVAITDGTVQTARIVLGGVAPIPWRVTAVERSLIGHPLDRSAIEHAATESTRGAQPLSMNGYKIPLIQSLLRRALENIAGD